jgi:conjugative relaxase-like TrwC/TraI family protein
MISIRRISLGGGFRYLMESVAAGDGAAERTSPLSRYYASSGAPPGVFLGRGLGDLADGVGIDAGSEVSPEHLERMLVELADPVTGEPLGAAPTAGRNAVPVAGFDLTFSPPKSVSVAWALADEGTKAVIDACHRRAVSRTLSWAEDHVFHSRSGHAGVVEEDVTGVVAASFTHWSSRADDPQLHDHVVIWNRARSVGDGRWRTLDSRAIFKATTTLSELHQGVLTDLLTEALGYGWEARSRRHSPRPRYEIVGVPEALMAEFSTRAAAIAEAHRAQLASFRAAHGRAPSAVEAMRLRQTATVATRGAKSHRSLAELTESWRHRADRCVPRTEQVAWVSSLAARNDLPRLRRDDLAGPILTDAATSVLEAVSEHHATFSAMNVLAESHRVLHGLRFASPEERIATAAAICEAALERSVSLAPASLAHTPARFRRADGSSRLAPPSRTLYTTQALLDAESRLLAAGRDDTAPRIPVGVVADVADRALPGRAERMSVDQALAVERIATSGRVLDVLVGPAGTGKSTTMAGLRAVWEEAEGPGSVVGLAPSAVAAEVLGTELEIETENTAKWLTEWRRLPALTKAREEMAARLARAHPASAGAARLTRRVADLDAAIEERRLRAGQLVIVDEASLAGTFALDELVAAARGAGAKVVLVGDPAQLSAVDAGGAFDLVARDRGDLAPRLAEVRRFAEAWEKVASVELRLGNPAAIDAYEDHGRIESGGREAMLDALYLGWKEDVDAGKASVMIAVDAETAIALNRRARADRVAAGEVAATGVPLSDGGSAGVGDEVVTRENNRLLTTGRGFVKNGDRFVVAATHEDGSVAVRRLDGPGEVVLPADYVARHVELAYATTAHRAQGRTVDTAHAFVSGSATRELLYVSATRGRESNRLYVDLTDDPDPATSHGEGPLSRPGDVLARILAREGAEHSAHEALRRAREEAGSLATLVAEYQTIARVADEERWDSALERCGLDARLASTIRADSAYGPLLATLREVAARGLDAERLLTAAVAERPLDDAASPAALLRHRLERVAQPLPGSATERRGYVAGLVPRATGVEDGDLARALVEREDAMQTRALELASTALGRADPWVRSAGTVPAHPGRRAAWLDALGVVAAYRERWGITRDQRPLGEDGVPSSVEEFAHRRRAEAALREARRLGARSTRVEENGEIPVMAVEAGGIER